MKFFIAIIATIIFAHSAHGDTLSDCQAACFDAKKTCNINKTHTFNRCEQELFSCRASCNSGKKQDSYTSRTIPLDIAFQPILNFDR